MNTSPASQPTESIDHAGIWRHRHREGRVFAVEISSHLLPFNGRAAELVLAYDVTERQQAESRLRESYRFANAILDALALNIAVLDESGAIINTNREWREFSSNNSGDPAATGVGANYVETTRRSAALGDRDATVLLAGLEQIMAGEISHFSHEYPCHSPSQQRWYVVHVTAFHDAGPLRIVVAHETVTERKLAELKLLKVNSYLAALSEMNQTITRSREAATILNAVCRIAVEHGELELVWVGKLEGGQRINPVASHGPAVGYLNEITVSADANTPEGMGPAGIAVRDGITTVFNQFDSDSRSALWHAQAQAWNLRAVLACPIKGRHGTWGEIAFYSSQRNYFSSDLVKLLEELTDDLAFSLDIVEIERSRAAAEAQLLFNAKVIESSHEGMFIVDSDYRFTMVNKAFCEITGYSSEELIGKQAHLLKVGRQDEAVLQQILADLSNTGRWDGDVWDRRKDGETIPVRLVVTKVHNDYLNSDHYVAMYSDITTRKEYESKIEHIASHDTLTNLPNRVLFSDRISVAIAQAERRGGRLGMLFVDLDRFKLINDTLGHDSGDQVLREVANRIVAALRTSDTVSRIGGDEFVILLHDIDKVEDAAIAAMKIIQQVAPPCLVNGREVVVTASIGIAIYPDDSNNAAELSRLADVAMLTAKRTGRNRYHFYSGEAVVNAKDSLELENDLRRAISRGELFVAYQPQCALGDKRLIGMEALARWQHPKYGLVPPGRFIPIAEDSGLILEIGNWIMHEACRQASQWRARGLISVPVSVNVSALQFNQSNFVQTVKAVLDATGLPVSCLELELTESVVMNGADQMLDKLKSLHSLGVKLAIDDFGTGYSSLSYLRQFPAQRLKIDQSFVRDLPHNQDAAAIARAIVSLGNTLGMSTIAEGVETEEQADFLRSIWCEQGQGYLYAKPMASSDLEAWLTARQQTQGVGNAG